MIKDFFKLALRSISERKTRSGLTILGILIGITAVVALISLGQGMNAAVSGLFSSIGSDRIIITPGGGGLSGPPGGELSVAKITERDVDLIKEVSGVEHAAGIITKSARVEFSDKVGFGSIFGFPTDDESIDQILSIDAYKIDEGREFKDGDRKKAVVGYSLAKNTGRMSVFDEKIDVGSNIIIEGVKFKVIGTQEKSGSPMVDRIIRISVDDAKEIFDEPDSFSMIFAKVKKGFEPAEVADRIEEAMRKDRNLKEGKEDFSVTSSEQLVAGVSSVLTLVQVALIGIASISLLVGSVNIMNTMYTSVVERTKIIGIMKSIGARNLDVLLIFLFEAGILGILGGIGGIIIGLLLANVVGIVAAAQGISLLKAVATPELIIGALAFSFFIGIAAGVLPAIKASRMLPTQALRWK